jgi:D-alanyl-D-alanine carboxypeptidase/D-alanyl-D-alanine-endopeptidase (penicillin-binding protein 4)
MRMRAALRPGTRVVRQFLRSAGVAPEDFYFLDGSGMSANDLIAPRAYTALLVVCGAAALGRGVEGDAADCRGGWDAGRALSRVALKGKLFAKTGTMSEDNALSGYLTAASGKTLAFSILVNGHLPGSDAELRAMDRICEAIAAVE